MPNRSKTRDNGDMKLEKVSKIISILCLLMSLSLCSFLLMEYYRFENATHAEKLQRMWEEDVSLLTSLKKLPASWGSLKEIKYSATSKEDFQLVQKLTSPIRLNKDGKFRMNILLLSWEDGNEKGYVFQYDIFNIKTKNLVWELGRTFVLEQKPKLALKANPKKQSAEKK